MSIAAVPKLYIVTQFGQQLDRVCKYAVEKRIEHRVPEPLEEPRLPWTPSVITSDACEWRGS